MLSDSRWSENHQANTYTHVQTRALQIQFWLSVLSQQPGFCPPNWCLQSTGIAELLRTTDDILCNALGKEVRERWSNWQEGKILVKKK